MWNVVLFDVVWDGGTFMVLLWILVGTTGLCCGGPSVMIGCVPDEIGGIVDDVFDAERLGVVVFGAVGFGGGGPKWMTGPVTSPRPLLIKGGLLFGGDLTWEWDAVVIKRNVCLYGGLCRVGIPIPIQLE